MTENTNVNEAAKAAEIGGTVSDVALSLEEREARVADREKKTAELEKI